MPATEQTWRSSTLLHRIFGATGFLLLGATIWMLYADHSREWKQYQDTARQMDLRYNEWLQLQYRTDAAVREHERLSAEQLAAEASDVPASAIATFAKLVADDAEVKRAYERQELPDLQKRLTDAVEAVARAEGDSTRQAAQLKAAQRRTELVAALDEVVKLAKFRETNKLDERKSKSGELDAAKANYDLAVRDNLANLADFQAVVDGLKAEFDELTKEFQSLADRRKKLQDVVRDLTADVTESTKRADASRAELKTLQTAFHDRSMNYFTDTFPWLGKKWLTLPILDAFNSPRRIDNLWSDDLTINYNFRTVRRFDRCTTCHQALEKSLPGQADKPLFLGGRNLKLTMATPTAADIKQAREEYAQLEHPSIDEDRWLLQKLYGIRLAAEGLIDSSDVTVSLVMPGSLGANAESESTGAAKVAGGALRDKLLRTPHGETIDPNLPEGERPGLAVGDVIQTVAGSVTDSPEKVLRQLLVSASFGKPIELVVRRGFAHPYSSHPRLDLFVGSLSPHKVSTFACTICHEGQGSATQFKWASHSPASVRQRDDWSRDHGWFDNGHWIYPMYSKRFIEATCLKCHHEVVELQPSERFQDAPAPKLIHGYDLLRKYGCYGCHEINGFDGPNRRIGPDLRIEPNFFAAALQFKSLLKSGDQPAWGKLTDEERGWVEQVAEHPENDSARHRMLEMLNDDARHAQPRFSDAERKLAGVLKDVETPGKMRKPGPSLRYAAHKLDEQFMFDWIREPKHFRPSTRMPQFFGFRAHLEDDKSRQIADQFEPVEILGMVTYLRQRSQAFDYLPKEQIREPAGASESERAAARVARGKSLFEQRGCLACHTHGEFPDVGRYRAEGEIVQGPDLTGLGSKFDPQRNPRGADWLYSWIKQPTRYHTRTVMPDLFLSPVANRNAEGVVESVTDPAADIVAYLLQSTNPNWQPSPEIDGGKGASLDQLVRDNLEESFFKEAAARYAQSGIPPEMRDELKGPERELLVDGTQPGQPLSETQKLLYIGARSIFKYGCAGCHDIPGFEDAKTIGTGLADWGRKDPAKLAFEHITHYLGHHGGGQAHEGSAEDADHEQAASEREAPPDFYHEHILSGHREGFIWQKLAEPRSFDFMKTENKRYNEWLRMPKFPFDANDREALITFVLGLVAEPPPAKYLYKPDPRSVALIEGRKVLEKYNCGGCHLLEPEKWKIAVGEGEIGKQTLPNLFPYLAPHISTEVLQDSLQPDKRGKFTATLSGMPSIDDAQARPRVNDSEGDPVDDSQDYDPRTVIYPFELWKTAVLDGNVYRAGILPLNIPASRIDRRYSAQGGTLARYLLPVVTRQEKEVNPGAKGTESWAWVPPPLVGEGRKVQSQWLHDFLLNPYPIRPAVVLRMPRFNMSPDEATALARYFAAVDDVVYPMEPNPRRSPAYLASQEAAYTPNAGEGGGTSRLDDALKIVVNQNYCVKCHLVGDFEPKGSDRAKAPNLARIHDRLRPDYLREWISNPKQVLPYTAMPLNIPYDPNEVRFQGGVDQKLFHGSSTDQVDGLVDLLLNFDNYSKSRNLITPLVPKEAPKPADAGSDAKPAS